MLVQLVMEIGHLSYRHFGNPLVHLSYLLRNPANKPFQISDDNVALRKLVGKFGGSILEIEQMGSFFLSFFF